MKSIALALLLGISVAACQQAKSARGDHWPKEAKELATYATQIPIYPGAQLDDAMGADLYGDTKADHTKRMTFFFDCDDSAEEIIAWYEEHLPDAERSELEEGTIEFTQSPEGGEEGENIGVQIDTDGSLRIFENKNAGGR